MANAENNTLDAVERGAKLLRSNPTCREILRWALVRCEGEMVSLSQLEREIAALPEYDDSCPEPYFIAQWLADAGCMDFFEVDSGGVAINRAAMEAAGASEDDIDDAIVGYAYQTNEAGGSVAAGYSPSNRVAALMADRPELKPALLEVLAYLKTAHSLGDVSDHVGHLAARGAEGQNDISVNPIALVNKLSDAGAISFVDHKWRTTEEGMQLLQSMTCE